MDHKMELWHIPKLLQSVLAKVYLILAKWFILQDGGTAVGLATTQVFMKEHVTIPLFDCVAARASRDPSLHSFQCHVFTMGLRSRGFTVL